MESIKELVAWPAAICVLIGSVAAVFQHIDTITAFIKTHRPFRSQTVNEPKIYVGEERNIRFRKVYSSPESKALIVLICCCFLAGASFTYAATRLPEFIQALMDLQQEPEPPAISRPRSKPPAPAVPPSTSESAPLPVRPTAALLEIPPQEKPKEVPTTPQAAPSSSPPATGVNSAFAAAHTAEALMLRVKERDVEAYSALFRETEAATRDTFFETWGNPAPEAEVIAKVHQADRNTYRRDTFIDGTVMMSIAIECVTSHENPVRFTMIMDEDLKVSSINVQRLPKEAKAPKNIKIRIQE